MGLLHTDKIYDPDTTYIRGCGISVIICNVNFDFFNFNVKSIDFMLSQYLIILIFYNNFSN